MVDRSIALDRGMRGCVVGHRGFERYSFSSRVSLPLLRHRMTTHEMCRVPSKAQGAREATRRRGARLISPCRSDRFERRTHTLMHDTDSRIGLGLWIDRFMDRLAGGCWVRWLRRATDMTPTPLIARTRLLPSALTLPHPCSIPPLHSMTNPSTTPHDRDEPWTRLHLVLVAVARAAPVVVVAAAAGDGAAVSVSFVCVCPWCRVYGVCPCLDDRSCTHSP